MLRARQCKRSRSSPELEAFRSASCVIALVGHPDRCETDNHQLGKVVSPIYQDFYSLLTCRYVHGCVHWIRLNSTP